MTVGIDQALDALEQDELRSLQWGYVDGHYTKVELTSLLASALNLDPVEDEASIDQIVRLMLREKVIYRFKGSNDQLLFRSRFAEGLRLLSRLTQEFPNKRWPKSQSLVNDFRVDVRPRRYPRRSVQLSEVAVRFRGALGRVLDPVEDGFLTAFLTAPSGLINLAEFQCEASTWVLSDSTETRGLVITAGTGTGKTIAFYLPAFFRCIEWKRASTDDWVKGVAVYPRNELLKDQFTEAFRLARRLDGVFERAGLPPIRLGTFYGDTPRRLRDRYVFGDGRSWEPSEGGRTCPFLKCPSAGCGGDMIWRFEDLERFIENLHCEQCGLKVGPEHLALSREQVSARLPDFVFTSAEMLHQRLSDRSLASVFGIQANAARCAQLMLLDEIHTYEGATGANTALMISRWRHARKTSPVSLVGLSATLEEASRFFGDLVGLEEGVVAEARPHPDDFDETGAQYQVILRGDPSSRAQLLSTSIQASFLLARLLERPVGGNRADGPLYGSRLFVFTDDLDATNRLFDDLRDAEGHDQFGRPQRPPLAQLRGIGADNRAGSARWRAGQVWELPNSLGWTLKEPPLGTGVVPTLSDRLQITRTTSHDVGVDTVSNVIVATSSLEVGFNDPEVGAVLQHKAPRSFASFMQRRGRAGRVRSMRPWMVTVLSDFGRDRLAYQAYDRMFDPTVVAQNLPVQNMYILKIQATFSMIDWLVHELPDHSVWWWRVLRGPEDAPPVVAARDSLSELIVDILDGNGLARARLSAHLSQALRLTDAQVQSVMYDPPRSLMFEVLPTIRRRLVTNWRACPRVNPRDNEAPPDLIREGASHTLPLLPEFVPATLFGELNVPDVTIVLPPAVRGAEEQIERMGLSHALQHWVPGQISRRFAVQRGRLAHWVSLGDPLPSDGMFWCPISRFASASEYVSDVPATIDGVVTLVPCFRPVTIRPQIFADRTIGNTSRGRLHWESTFEFPFLPAQVALPEHDDWARWIPWLQFSLHTLNAPAVVRRYASTATTILRKNHMQEMFTTLFIEDGVDASLTPADDGDIAIGEASGESAPSGTRRAAVGFQLSVDAMSAFVSVPEAAVLAQRLADARSLPAWRIAYWRDLVTADRELGTVANVFQLGWLEQVFLSAATALAIRVQTLNLSQAIDALVGQEADAMFLSVIRGVFNIGEGSGDEETSNHSVEADTNAGALLALLQNHAVVERLKQISSVLSEPVGLAFAEWARRRLKETIAEALLAACTMLVPRQAATDTLIIDLSTGPRVSHLDGEGHESASDVVIISESTLGGTGVLAEIARVVSRQPQALLAALNAVVAPSELEMVASGLEQFVKLSVDDVEVANAVGAVRAASGHVRHEAARIALAKVLSTRGVILDHSLSAALHHRVLRTGTSNVTDILLSDILGKWKSETQRLGIAIPVRSFAYCVASDDDLGPRLRAMVAGITGEPPGLEELTSVLVGFLWAQEEEVRKLAFESPSWYRDRGFTDAALVRELLAPSKAPVVRLTSSPEWYDVFTEFMQQKRTVRLVAAPDESKEFQTALFNILSSPISVRFLSLYPTIENMGRDGLSMWAMFTLREV